MGDAGALNSSHLVELLAQSLQGVGGAPHAEESALTICTLFQHLAAREDFAAQLLCRPGKEQLGLDQILLEKCDDCLV